MTQQESLTDTPSALPIAGFWRRTFAFILDAAVALLPGFTITQLMIHAPTVLGSFYYLSGAYFSLLIFIGCVLVLFPLIYFSFFNSRWGGGRTLGMRLFGIKVIHSNGNPLSLLRAILRNNWMVLGLVPHFAYSLSLGEPAAWVAILALAVNLLVTSLMMASIYLFIFNSKTRQTVWDKLSRAVVVKHHYQGPVELPKIARIHRVMARSIGLFPITFILLVLGERVYYNYVFQAQEEKFLGNAPTEILKVPHIIEVSKSSCTSMSAKNIPVCTISINTDFASQDDINKEFLDKLDNTLDHTVPYIRETGLAGVDLHLYAKNGTCLPMTYTQSWQGKVADSAK